MGRSLGVEKKQAYCVDMNKRLSSTRECEQHFIYKGETK